MSVGERSGAWLRIPLRKIWKVKARMDPEFMREAIRLALDNVANNGGGPFAAVVVKDRRIIARGVNRVTANHDPTAHAEIMAIRGACAALGDFQLAGCEIYSSCEPCPMCLGAIYWARPARVYFAATRDDAAQAGFDDSLIYSEMQTAIDSRRIPTLPLLRDEALPVFDAWRDRDSKIPY